MNDVDSKWRGWKKERILMDIEMAHAPYGGMAVRKRSKIRRSVLPSLRKSATEKKRQEMLRKGILQVDPSNAERMVYTQDYIHPTVKEFLLIVHGYNSKTLRLPDEFPPPPGADVDSSADSSIIVAESNQTAEENEMPEYKSTGAKIAAEKNIMVANIMETGYQYASALDALRKKMHDDYMVWHEHVGKMDVANSHLRAEAIEKLGQLGIALKAVENAYSATNSVRCFS